MDKTSISRSEWKWVIWVSLAIVLGTMVPYAIGYAFAGPGYRFIGFMHNGDDMCVYLSWMRQAADGNFFIRNLFTTEPQIGKGFNIFFYVLGKLAHFAHLPLAAMLHIVRVISGFALLLAIYILSSIWIENKSSRRLCLLITGTSAGLGFLFVGVPHSTNAPVDLWQPEAITFLSIYLSPLYTFPTLLMVGIIFWLYKFATIGQWKHAIFAGVGLLLLSNIHTYDIIPLGLTWAFYSLLKLALKPRNSRVLVGGATALLIASPAIAYQAYFFLSEPVFRMRAAVPTTSPSIVWYITGYGLLLVFALIGVWQSRRNNDLNLLVCWCLAGFIAAYLPVTFQRKLIMGTHIPLSILATMGVTAVTSRILKDKYRTLFSALILLAMVPSNMVVIAWNIGDILQNQVPTAFHTPYISEVELNALSFLRAHAKPDEAILGPPSFSVLVPGFTGRTVYCGHWGETVRFWDKLLEVGRFYVPDTSDDERRTFLRKHRISWVVECREESSPGFKPVNLSERKVDYLKPAFDQGGIVIYRVVDDGKV
ncbi:MAG: hypothetical protein QHH26_04385 [Armatimonadota bacterium]|nr:hypothetical protein [Armatimonadota bacterium]